MAEIIYMPKLSDTMTEGVVASWLKKVGDPVSNGEVIAEIETDKATMEFESFYDGILLHIGVEKGAAAPVNAVLAIIGQKGEDVKKILANAQVATPVAEETPAKPEIKETPVSPAPEQPAKKEVRAEKAPIQKVDHASTNERIYASPLARKLADERGIDLSFVSGTGEGGRVTKRDVEHYVPYQGGGQRRSFTATESFHDEPVSQMRKTIARRLAESKFTAPHFYLTIDIDMENAMALRSQFNALENGRISYNDMVIKAAALALRMHPNVNSAWMGDFIRRNEHVHIGVAVAVDEGLLVPVVRFADNKELTAIGEEVKQFAEKAKQKKLQPQDWEGNTFTISNLGMFGIDEFTAIINPPDSCIMAVGSIRETPVVKNKELVIGNRMKVTLSCDHRVVDGVSGASFLETFKKYLENPISLFTL